MIIEVKVPSPGESISEVQLASWLVNNGDFVEKDTEIAEIDSDKATLTINAVEAGVIQILVEAGETIKVGSIVAKIDTSSAKPVKSDKPEKKAPEKAEPVAEPVSKPVEPVKETIVANKETTDDSGLHISPLARKLMQEKNVTGNDIIEYFSNLRISKADVEEVASNKNRTTTIIRSGKFSGKIKPGRNPEYRPEKDDHPPDETRPTTWLL